MKRKRNGQKEKDREMEETIKEKDRATKMAKEQEKRKQTGFPV